MGSFVGGPQASLVEAVGDERRGGEGGCCVSDLKWLAGVRSIALPFETETVETERRAEEANVRMVRGGYFETKVQR